MRLSRNILFFVSRCLLGFLLAFCFNCSPGYCAEIGQTREEIIAQHGPPPFWDGIKGTIIYRWDLWKLEIEFVNNIARKLTYTKTDPLLPGDIQGILIANGGANAWRQLNNQGWMRSDFAIAVVDERHRTVRLNGLKKYAPIVAQASGNKMGETAVSTTPPPKPSSLNLAPSQTSVTGAPSVPSPTLGLPLGPSPSPFRENPSSVPVLHPVNGVNLTKRGPAFYLLPWAVLIALAYYLSKNMKKREYQVPPVPTPMSAPISNVWQRPSLTPDIDSVTWDQFELVISEIYKRKGYSVEISLALGADGGVDISISRDGVLTYVQCKQRKEKAIGVQTIRELLGVCVSAGVRHGVVITTSDYTRDAWDFAGKNPIDLFTRSDVLNMVKSVERPGENLWNVSSWIDDFVSNVRLTHPECPYCHAPMVLRHTKAGEPLWGCPGYPRCKGVRDVRPDLEKALSYRGMR